MAKKSDVVFKSFVPKRLLNGTDFVSRLVFTKLSLKPEFTSIPTSVEKLKRLNSKEHRSAIELLTSKVDKVKALFVTLADHLDSVVASGKCDLAIFKSTGSQLYAVINTLM